MLTFRRGLIHENQQRKIYEENMRKTMGRRQFVEHLTGGFLTASVLPKTIFAQQPEKILAKKMGVALVGLGYYSTQVLAPALQETKNVRLAGIVTGTPEKEQIWRDKYGIPAGNIYNYKNFDAIADNPDIDIIYVVLPNALHAEYVIRAARAGKPVICEKPMALSVSECASMIEACRQNNVALSIGYRMQFEPHTQEVIRYAKEKTFGSVTYVEASAGFFNRSDKSHWKLQRALGGGVVMDMGVYSIQAARYSVGGEPMSVQAQAFVTRPELYDDVEEVVTFQLEFSGGVIANCMTSFAHNINLLHVVAEKGWYQLNPMSSYSGIKMTSSRGPVAFENVNQQAAQMDEVAWCIANKLPMRTPGEEGLRDLKVVEALYRSLRTGSKEKIV